MKMQTLKSTLWLPLVALGLALVSHQAAAQTTIAKWAFEVSLPAGAPGAGNWITNIAPEIGVGTASAKHATAATYGTSAGNGTAKAMTSANWSVNDFYQFAISATGFTNLTVSFDQLSSGTGPGRFTLNYSTDGVTFTQFGAVYNVTNLSWSAAAPIAGTSYSFDLSTVTALANAPIVYFRLIDNSTTSANSGTVGTSGTDRIDNVAVNGTIVGSPKIILQPAATTTAYYGDTVSLNVTAGGDNPISYQWFTNSTPPTALVDGPSGYGSGTIAGSTSGTLTFTFVNPAQAGNYFVVVSNTLNTATSSVAHLTVNLRTPIATNIAYLRKLHDTNFALTDTTNIYVIEGIVTTPINLVSGLTEVESYYIQDTNGYGCDVFFRGGFYFGNPGDKVRVTAPLLQFQGALELAPVNGNPAHNVELLSTGNPVPAPKYFDFTTMPSTTNIEEQLEGSYLVVSNVFFGVSSAAAGHFVADGSVYLTNQFGKTFYAHIPNSSAVDLVGTAVPGTFAKSIRGVMVQIQTSGVVLTNGYSIFLAQSADLQVGSPVTTVPDAYSMASNTTSLFPVLANDSVLSPLFEGTLTVSAVSAPSGVAAVDGTGTNITFTPDADYVGTVTIGYTATDTAGYSSDGVATVTVTNVPPAPTTIIPTVPPAITSLVFTNGNLVITGTNAQATGVYYLLSTTNVALPKNQWTAVATNVVGTANSFTFIGTNVVAPGNAQQFYILSSTNNH